MSDYRKSIVIDIDGKGAVVGARTIEGALKEIDSAARGSSGAIDSVGAAGKSASASMEMMGSAAKAALGYFSVAAMAGFAKSVFDAGVAMDSLQRSLVAITGSQVGASMELAFIRSEADRLGQSLYDIAPAYKNLAAASRGTALEGEGTRKIFSAITEASTALGMSTSDTEGALRAIGQMMSKGNVQAEELRGQLGERLPGAFKMMADALGVSQQALNKMLEQGEVLAEDALPKLADAIHKAYGAAAQTAALESAQAAVNRMSQEWTDLKNNLFNSESAVVGINLVTDAIAGLNSMISQVQQNKVQWIWEGLKMEAMDPSTYRGKVNRDMVMPAYVKPTPTTPPEKEIDKAAAKRAASALSKVQEEIAKLSMSAADFELYQIDQEFAKIAKEIGAANPLLKQWVDLRREEAEVIRKKSVDKELEDFFSPIDKESEKVSEKAAKDQEKNLELITEFADKYKEVVLGETEFKMVQIEAQGEAYRKAGADEVAVAQYVKAEKLKYSREWQDGATRALQAYADEASNAALAVESVMNTAFQGMEDVIVEFVKTGKLEFSDLVTSINAEIARLAFKSLASESYNFLGSVLNMGLSAAGSYFGGGTAVSSAAGSSGAAGTLSSMFARNAKGGVYDSPSLSSFSGGVYSSPQFFAFAKGAGVFAEAGPEAIMPLKRGPDGSLGVQAGGGDGETKALLRELIAVNRAQKPVKNVIAWDRRALANELSGTEGEQMNLMHIRKNATAINRILGRG